MSRFLTVAAVLVLVSAATLWPDRATLPLPAPDRPGGTAFDTSLETQERRVLVGFFLPSGGPISAIAPLTSSWEADGSLGQGRGEPWKGPIPKLTQRIEKSGYLPAGLRLLLILTPDRSAVAQLQILWRAWKDGVWSGDIVPSRVFGRAAGPKDATRVVTLRIEQGGTPVGLWGTFDARGLRQVSLVLNETPTARPSASRADGQEGPRPPVPPVTPRVQLNDSP